MLSQIAREVLPEELRSPHIQALIDDLVSTLRAKDGLGIAAPQVSESLRICIVGKPLTVLVNPVLTPIGDETDESYEACLSVPELVGVVRRPQTVRVQALDRYGKSIDMVWTKFRAIVVQHEVDHLNGILYTERATSTSLSDEARAELLPAAEQQAAPAGSKRQTLVIESPGPVGGRQYVVWTFQGTGRVTGLRIQPGGARVTAAWLSGVRFKAKNYPAGAAERHLLGDRVLHVARGEMLRVELEMPRGKRRIVAEADVDFA